MTYLDREMTRHRLTHQAALLRQASEQARDAVARLLEQCDNLEESAALMEDMVEELGDLGEVERLAGSPVRRVA